MESVVLAFGPKLSSDVYYKHAPNAASPTHSSVVYLASLVSFNQAY